MGVEVEEGRGVSVGVLLRDGGVLSSVCLSRISRMLT